VRLAGEFNGWTPSRTELTLEEGKWVTTLYLDRGRYQYQVHADGKQMTDPSNPDSVDNNMGAFNSVLYAGGKDRPEPLWLTSKKTKGHTIWVQHDREVEQFFVFWENFRIPDSHLETKEGMIRFDIPAQAEKMQQSFIRVWAYNEDGLSNDLLIPVENGRVVQNPGSLARTDFRSAIIYNAFIDRFNNGDESNDRPLRTPEVLPPADYHGGDIAGVLEKVNDGYFEELGINTIWISPIVKNPEEAFGFWPEPASKFSGYHGYWPISFTEIDDRYGTPEELENLVSASHANNMNVLLDFVANHVHEQHPVYQANPDWATNLYLPDGTLNTEKWDEYRLTTWFDVFLPTLNLERPEVTEMLSDSALWWLERYNLDGFRHDATKHIPEIFWRTLSGKVKSAVVEDENRNVYQIGETYGSPQLISSYVSSGMLDGQFDFNVYDAALGAFAKDGESFENLNSRLMQSLEYYGYHNRMGYITGNQDRGRFVSYAGGDLKFDEDAKAAGWTREIAVGDPAGYDKLQMLMAFNMTIPGIPVIYYGDEIGMPGGNDPDDRRMMRYDDLSEREMETLEVTKKLTKMRRDHMSLLYGTLIPVKVEGSSYIYARKYFDETAIVLFNKSRQEITLQPDLGGIIRNINIVENYGGSYELEGGEFLVTLPPLSFSILIHHD
jgi:glycosidase